MAVPRFNDSLQQAAVALAVSIALSVAFALLAAWPLSPSQPKQSADDVARQFCVTPAPDAKVGSDDMSDEQLSLRVPREAASNLLNAPSLAVQSGHVVKLTVSSEQAGAVGIHGLSMIEAVHSGESVVIKFRAIYTGRFPLHFHGTDGSHFELMAVNVTADADARAPH